MKPILEIQNISKKFTINREQQPYLSLRDSISQVFKSKKSTEDFWALDNVSFNVEVGDTVYSTAHGQFGIRRPKTGADNLVAASVLDILVILKDMETLEIQPLGSYIEIEKVEYEVTDEYGIELPDSKKPPTNIGIVKAVGIGWTGPYGDPIPMQVSVGDKVAYSPLRTMVIDFSALGTNAKKYVIQHGDILARIIEK